MHRVYHGSHSWTWTAWAERHSGSISRTIWRDTRLLIDTQCLFLWSKPWPFSNWMVSQTTRSPWPCDRDAPCQRRPPSSLLDISFAQYSVVFTSLVSSPASYLLPSPFLMLLSFQRLNREPEVKMFLLFRGVHRMAACITSHRILTLRIFPVSVHAAAQCLKAPQPCPQVSSGEKLQVSRLSKLLKYTNLDFVTSIITPPWSVS